MVIECIWDTDLTRPLTKKTLIQDCYRIKLFAVCVAAINLENEGSAVSV